MMANTCARIRRFVTGVAISAAALTASQGALAEKLTVYTTTVPEMLGKYRDSFQEQYPEIEIEWLRDSTGVITARLLAERENTSADVIFAMAVPTLIALKKDGLLTAYEPKGADAIPTRFKDSDTPPSWIGEAAYIAVFCVNTVEAEKRGIPIPQTWDDLLKPAYKGQIVMPNPASSGTGFITVSGWLQQWGEEKAWKYMDALHENVALYDHSGARPCTLAAQGEYTIGVSIDSRAGIEKEQGAPIEIVVPEFVGWELNGTAITARTDNLDAAKKFMDWSATPAAHKLHYEVRGIVALKDAGQPPEGFPAEAPDRLANNDFNWQAENRDRLLAESIRRYDQKSAPKN